jgi:transposase
MEAAAHLDYKALYEAEKNLRESLEGKLAQAIEKAVSTQLSIDTLRHELEQLKKIIFGSRHERFVPASHPSQLSLGIVCEPLEAPAIVSTQKIEFTRTQKEAKKPFIHPGRNPLPAHLRREEIILEPADIPQNAKRIGEEITEELEYTPGELFVKQYVRPKYVKSVGEDGSTLIVIAPLPVRPLDRAIAGPGLLAQVVIDKYVDHLPLYRQLSRFERADVKLPYSTLSDWVSGTCKLIAPLYEALKTEVLQASYLHVDETTIKVLDKTKKGKTHRGYFWVYNNCPGKLVFFDYQEGREEKWPQGILKDYQGYLQADGYVGYEGFADTSGITLLNCMAHARRKFVEALDNNKAISEYALEQMQALYAIERECKEKNRDPAARQLIRQQQAVPILKALGQWMKEQYTQVLPKSIIGQALAYSITRWERLSLYTTNGILNIDNNPVENSIRPVAIGRKNYLFCGSHEAARRSAMLYSLLGTCKMNGVNPYDWLKDVLTIIPAHPINQIRELLPHKWGLRQKSAALLK